ncbi:hypothetical protein [Natronomonas gomsonensis]|uniref:DUF7123 family protein n=1 Tax=Natronomonas gomsonensis TaxID=1046043 RepID=UPI0015BE5C4E|nr:hypothetical protein [Natronomonas gomsonensis]
MSTNASTQSPYRSRKAKRLVEYLRAEAERNDGDLYIKGKFIADDVELSPKEIGALLSNLQGSVPGLTIEKWSYTSATTWRISSA